MLCTLGGALCAWLRTPLPWMVGSLFAMAAAKMSGARVVPLPGGREAGMLVVGVSLGLYFTIPVVHEVAGFWPWFVFLGFAAIGVGATSALLLMRLGNVDRATAYFGSMPGGAADMATMAERHGAQPHLVAFAHSVRMLLVVSLIPSAITLAGFSATEDYRPVLVPLQWGGLAILIALAAVAGYIAKRVGALEGDFRPQQVMRGVEHMTDLVLTQIKDVLDSFARRDAAEAMAVWRSDEEVDAVNNSLFRELLTYMMEDPRDISYCIHLLFCAKNIERMGDHATNIAETVHYIVEGRALADERPKGDNTSFTAMPFKN